MVSCADRMGSEPGLYVIVSPMSEYVFSGFAANAP